MIQAMRIAWRNFLRNHSRYRLLIIALSIAVMVQFIILGSVLGMIESLSAKGARYFGGDIVLLGYRAGSSTSIIEDVPGIERVLGQAGIDATRLIPRSMYYRSDAELFFHGNRLLQRRLIGVNWHKEQELLNSFHFVDGGVPLGLDHQDDQAILISHQASRILGLQVGDEVLLSLTTQTGQRNTGMLVVAGIFDEPSFFGFAAYLSASRLNSLLLREVDHTSELGILPLPGQAPGRLAQRVNRVLSQYFPTLGVFQSQDERDQSRQTITQEHLRHYGVMTLEANLAEITNLLQALTITAGFLIGLFLVIVIVGVGNTYRMIVFERTFEIGTMRAIGLTQVGTGLLFLFEALFLGVISTGIGGVLGFIGLTWLQQARFAGLDAITLFLDQGRLSWSLPLPWVFSIFAIVILASVLGCLVSALRAAKLSPVEALRQE
jgi:putative ABC transport system permease protein